MITKPDGKVLRPHGDINTIHRPVKPTLFGFIIYREPMRKRWARCGVKQSDLNYGGVR